MTEYQIQPNTRRCAVSGRELKPGERYFSVLLDEAGKFVRKDYGAEAWQGPPADAFSFWAGRVPAAGDRAGRPSTTTCCWNASGASKAGRNRRARTSATCWPCC